MFLEENLRPPRAEFYEILDKNYKMARQAGFEPTT